jgi:hypothetical protein
MKKIFSLLFALIFVFSLLCLLNTTVSAEKDDYTYYTSMLGKDNKFIEETFGKPTTVDDRPFSVNKISIYYYAPSGIYFTMHSCTTVVKIEFTKPTVNFKGVTIGSSKEDVIKAFGSPTEEGASLMYKYEDFKVIFQIEQKVTKMTLEKTVIHS